MLLGVYLPGALGLLLRRAMGTIRANRLTSADCVAPITVGMFRPRVILPESWTEWTRERLAAILAHEHAHLRRRDPLVQWLALLNRAVFWFHPLAWWLERQLAALAEEACDAVVLERGHDAGEYAQCLLEMERAVMQAGARFPPLGMAMPGSALPHRIKKILEVAMPARLSRTRMLCAIAACAVMGALFGAGTLDHIPADLPLRPLPAFALPQPPVLIAQTRTEPVPVAPAPAKLEFEVASVRPATPGQGRGRGGNGPSTFRTDPGLFVATNTPLKQFFRFAYDVKRYQQLTTPAWMDDARYDVTAKTSTESTTDEQRIMMRKLLADRFQLKFHMENKPTQVMALVIAKGGAKFHAVDPATATNGDLAAANVSFGMSPGFFGKQNMETLANMLSGVCGTLELPFGPVVDRTGLKGDYDLRVETVPNPDSGPRTLIDQYCEAAPKIGLEFKRETVPLDSYVIDSAEKTPTEN